MKKLIFALLACSFLTSQAFAGIVNQTIIAETTLDDSPTMATSDTVYMQDYRKAAFFVNYDETQVGNSISGTVTLNVSYDGTNFLPVSFYDYAGGATLQTSETISSDSWYYCYLMPYLNVPYAQMVISATNTDTDDTLKVTAYIVGTK